MSDLDFTLALFAIVVGAALIIRGGLWLAERRPRPTDEPTEHGDGEP
mgnify:CR=1 FL=1